MPCSKLTYSILREHKDRNADTDQNAGSPIWDFYGTGSDKTPNRSHLLENLLLFQLEHGSFSSLFACSRVEGKAVFVGSSSRRCDDGQRCSWFAPTVTNKSQTWGSIIEVSKIAKVSRQLQQVRIICLGSPKTETKII